MRTSPKPLIFARRVTSHKMKASGTSKILLTAIFNKTSHMCTDHFRSISIFRQQFFRTSFYQCLSPGIICKCMPIVRGEMEKDDKVSAPRSLIPFPTAWKDHKVTFGEGDGQMLGLPCLWLGIQGVLETPAVCQETELHIISSSAECPSQPCLC